MTSLTCSDGNIWTLNADGTSWDGRPPCPPGYLCPQFVVQSPGFPTPCETLLASMGLSAPTATPAPTTATPDNSGLLIGAGALAVLAFGLFVVGR